MLVDRIRRGGPAEFTRWSGFVVPDMGAGVATAELDAFSFEKAVGGGEAVSYSIFPNGWSDMVGYVTLSETVDETGLASFMGLPVGREFTEVEWFLFEEDRGRGFAEEALRAVLARYFDGDLLANLSSTVTAMVGAGDIENLSVASRVGFKDSITPAWTEPDVGEGEDPDDPVGALRMLTLAACDFEAGTEGIPTRA